MSIAMSTRLNNFGLYFNKAYHFSIEIAFTFCRIIKSDLHERFEIGVNSLSLCFVIEAHFVDQSEMTLFPLLVSRPDLLVKMMFSNPAGYCQQVICLRLLYF